MILLKSFQPSAALYASRLPLGTTIWIVPLSISNVRLAFGGVIELQVIDFNPEQPEIACAPRLLTDFGIVIDVSPVQSVNVCSLISFTESGIVIDFNPVQ